MEHMGFKMVPFQGTIMNLGTVTFLEGRRYSSFFSWDGIFHGGQQDSKTFGVTLPKTSIAPEDRPCQKETSLLTIHFQVIC